MNLRVIIGVTVVLVFLSACGAPMAQPSTTGLAPTPAPSTPVEVAPTPPPTAPATIPTLTMIPSEAESLCEAAFSSDVTEGSAVAPVRTLVNNEYEGEAWDFDPNTMVIPHHEPVQASEIHTLVCIKESRVQEVTYPDGEAGYRVVWDARAVLYPDGEVLGAQDFEGGRPLTPNVGRA